MAVEEVATDDVQDKDRNGWKNCTYQSAGKQFLSTRQNPKTSEGTGSCRTAAEGGETKPKFVTLSQNGYGGPL